MAANAPNFVTNAIHSMGISAHHETIASGIMVAVGLSVFALLARASLKRAENPIIPDDKLTSRNFAELIVLFIMKLGDLVMGKENRRYFPFVGCVFFFILFSNFLGLVPGFSMPTDAFWFNMGMALIVFICYHVWGIREVGLVNYIKHFFGGSAFLKLIMLPIGCMLFVIEIISHCVRPLSLSIRLFGNMTGDHIVLSLFTDLTKFIVPVVFYGLGTFVCFMQAFVFTLLTMIYIRFAVAHEEDH